MALYPPYIEGKLRTQVGGAIYVPFNLNRAVGYADLQGLQVQARIKNPSTNIVVGTLLGEHQTTTQIDVYLATFFNNKHENDKIFKSLEDGQYYKLQLGFGDGIFSTVSVFKYIKQAPQVFIQGLNSSVVNLNTQKYIGGFASDDSSEKVYHYWFELYQNGVLVENSGELLHNSSQDIDTKSSYDEYTLKTGLDESSYYQIRYVVKTNNDLVISSPLYHIEKTVELLDNNKIQFKAVPNTEDGAIDLFITGDSKKQQLIAGKYSFYRSEAENIWTEIGTVAFDEYLTITDKIVFYSDRTIVQGTKYRYALQRIHEDIQCKRLETDYVSCDFEDIYLMDSERQLRVRFDPKVSSLKDTILESKMETIGGQYPFVFRNGRTKYKEIPISGLISLLMDENNDFSLLRNQTPSNKISDYDFKTNLSGDNIAAERKFKLEVLDWLNNGQIKLFRSPTEGNYIVRLLNVSLSPVDTLGRMLHSFSATAYEMMGYSIENLIQQHFLGVTLDWRKQLHFTTIDLADYLDPTEIEIDSATYLTITNSNPGKTAATFVYASGDIFAPIISNTGTYELFISKNNPVVKIKTTPGHIGVITYATVGSKNYPIYQDGKIIVGYKINEVAEQYINNSNADELTIDTSSYNKITFLRIEAIDEPNTSAKSSHYKIQFKNSTTEEYYIAKEIQLNEGNKNSPLIEFNVLEWKDDPKSIILGPGLKADLYGRKMQVSYQ